MCLACAMKGAAVKEEKYLGDAERTPSLFLGLNRSQFSPQKALCFLALSPCGNPTESVLQVAQNRFFSFCLHLEKSLARIC